MFSVSPAEMLTIAVVILIVFGPKRLPEIARKAGGVIREIRETAADLRKGIEGEYGEVGEAFGEVRKALGSTLDDQLIAEPKPKTERGPEPDDT